MGTFDAGNTPDKDISDFDVIGINRKSIFNIDEAKTLFPIVFRLTKNYAERVQGLIRRIESIENLSKTRIDREAMEPLESEVAQLIQDWQLKIQKLGGLPNGHWVVDFDSGDGYFCWKYPERSIDFWHHYRDGFSKRIKLSALVKNQSFEPAPEVIVSQS